MFENFSQVEQFFIDREKYGIKPGLSRIKKLLYLIGNPQEAIKAIHVAGTNGKGSTINFLENALIANSYKVGVFTSPSINGLLGYIFLNNDEISENKFLQGLNNVYPAILSLDNEYNYPTEFEIITALAFYFFSESTDIALIETGMGGKEDTTNCFKPILSIITSIDKDHTAYLGQTLTEIATHKAGIIKWKVPVVVGSMVEESFKVISAEAVRHDTKIYKIDNQFSYKIINSYKNKQQFIFSRKSGEDLLVTIQSMGRHQIHNCSLALMALSLINSSNIEINQKLMLEGIYNSRLKGRFEVIHNNPTIILDGAHNPAGIIKFIETVKENYSNKDKHLLFTAFKDKDINSMLDELVDLFSDITITTFDNPRSMTKNDLKEIKKVYNVSINLNWQKELNNVILNYQSKNSVYFITGSLHFIAEVRQYIEINRNKFNNF